MNADSEPVTLGEFLRAVAVMRAGLGDLHDIQVWQRYTSQRANEMYLRVHEIRCDRKDCPNVADAVDIKIVRAVCGLLANGESHL